MSRVNPREVAFAEDWLIDIGAIDRGMHRITWKGLLMSEIPYDPDFAHMISSAIVSNDYDVARFLLASGAFGDSLNHAYRSDMEGVARQFLYGFDKSSELNIKAHLLRGYSGDARDTFTSRLNSNGIFTAFVDEAWKNHVAAREALNDLLTSSNQKPITEEILTDLNSFKLKPYLEDCLSFEKFDFYEKNEHDLHGMIIEGQFFARTLTINYRRVLFDVVAMNPARRNYHHHQRHQHRRS
jgi:hypothetical protein